MAHLQTSNILDPDQTRQNVGTDLDLNNRRLPTSLDPDQTRQNVGAEVDLNCFTL